MSDTRFDQTGRLTARLAPPAFFSWLLGDFALHLAFRRWLDPRSTPRPGQQEQTGDCVAELASLAAPASPWAFWVEFQTEPDPDMFGRLLGQLAQLWLTQRPDPLP